MLFRSGICTVRSSGFAQSSGAVRVAQSRFSPHSVHVSTGVVTSGIRAVVGGADVVSLPASLPSDDAVAAESLVVEGVDDERPGEQAAVARTAAAHNSEAAAVTRRRTMQHPTGARVCPAVGARSLLSNANGSAHDDAAR